MLLQSTSALLQGNLTTLLFFHLPNFSFLHLTQKIKQLCIRFNWHNHLLLLLRPKNNFCFTFSGGGKEKNWVNLGFVSPSVTTQQELGGQCRTADLTFPTCSPIDYLFTIYYLFLIPKVFPHPHKSKSALNSGFFMFKIAIHSQTFLFKYLRCFLHEISRTVVMTEARFQKVLKCNL